MTGRTEQRIPATTDRTRQASRLTRRTFLATGTALSVAGLAGCLGVGQSGPTAPVEAYYDAIQNAEWERAANQFHNESRIAPDVEDDSIEQEEEADISITTIENSSVQAYVEDSDVLDSESAVESDIGEQVEEVGAEDWTFVYVEGEGANGFPISRYYVVVKDDGEWKIFL